MLLEGVKLMFVGMGTVFLFLLLMIFLLQLVSKLTSAHTVREFEAIELERKLLAAAAKAKKQKELAARIAQTSPDDEDDIAIIGAAIAAYEADTFHGC